MGKKRKEVRNYPPFIYDLSPVKRGEGGKDLLYDEEGAWSALGAIAAVMGVHPYLLWEKVSALWSRVSPPHTIVAPRAFSLSTASRREGYHLSHPGAPMWASKKRAYRIFSAPGGEGQV